MKEYAEKKQPSFSTSPNVDIKFPYKEWYFDHSAIFISFGLGTGVHKNYCFVEYTPLNCFTKFVQSAVNASERAMKTQIQLLLQKQ